MALDHALGHICANDVSARNWQLKHGGVWWCRGKTFDTFSPLGPCLVTADEIPDSAQFCISTILNGETDQDWNTGDIIFDMLAIIEFISGNSTLLLGTVILTGPPHGVGMAPNRSRAGCKPADRVTIEIDRIGALTNHVVMELPRTT